MADVPAFDDIPSFDDLPDAAPPVSQAGGVPMFDDIPAFDDLPSARPEPEGKLATAGREAAHAVVPGLGGLAGMGAGALIGAPAGPAGVFIGGLVGGVAAGMGVGYAQEKALDALDINDREQRAANMEENPLSATAGGVAGGMLGMSPSAAASKLAPVANQIVQRGAGAAFGGAMELGQEAVSGEDLDFKKAAIAAAGGAVMPGVNKLGNKFYTAGERLVPGRPGRTANPAANQYHADVMDTTAEVEVGNSSLAQGPVATNTGETTGNPQSAPERSERNYAKDTTQTTNEGTGLTEGHIAPDTAAALQAEKPAAPPADVVGEQTGPSPAPENVSPPVNNVPQEAPAPQMAPEAPQGPVMDQPPVSANEAPKAVEAGFPQAGEPIAMGENDLPRSRAQIELERAQQQFDTATNAAVKKIAARRLERAKVEIAAEQASQPKPAELPEGEKEAPEIRGETKPGTEVTEGQATAGNYNKARTHDFGRPQAYETMAGDIRRGTNPDGTKWEHKSPYDYGYFNKTKGADKDHIDFARPKPDAPEYGNKHFIIDQKNAETGKFDEHKAFTYYRDEAAARKHYLEGFGDGKGEQRLGAITEVSRGDLVKFLAKHQNKAATTPFNKDFAAEAKAAKVGEKKPVRERAVYKDLIAKKPELAEALANAPDERIEQAIAGKRVRKYGVGTGASAGYPVEGVFTSDGRPVTANTKAKAAERSAAHKKVVDWFEKSAPKNAETETKDQLMQRLLKNAPNIEGWKPTHKPKEWMLAREAQRFLQKPTPAAEKKFREAERLLRGGDESVEAYRGGNRVEADIARSRRSGDEAVANAEAKNVDVGRNSAEDAMIEAIDAKREPRIERYKEDGDELGGGWSEFKLMVGDKMVGRATIDHGKNYIDEVYLTPEYRGKGYGKKLYDHIEKELGIKLQPSPRLGEGGKKFWDKRSADPLRGADRAWVEQLNGGPKPDVSPERMAQATEKLRALKKKFAEEKAADPLRGRKPGFDVPHEEAETMVKPKEIKSKADLQELPKKTVDVNDSSLASIDTKALDAAAMRKAEAANLVGKKSKVAAGTESEGAAGAVKTIKVTDPVEMAKYVDMLNKASAKPQGLDALPAAREPKGAGVRDLVDMFVHDQRGSGKPTKTARDIKRWLASGYKKFGDKTQHISYRAMQLRERGDQYMQSLSDKLHTIKKQSENDFLENIQRMKSWPEELRNPENQQLIYEARDKDSAHFPLPAGQTGTHIDNLPPKLKALYDEHMKPTLDRGTEFVKAIRAVSPDRVGEDVDSHIQRIAMGDSSEYNQLLPPDDPTSPSFHGLSVNAGSAKQRRFYALVGADGKRHVIQPTENGFIVWNGYKRENVKAPDFAFKDGDPFTAGKNQYTMRQATTKEIEDNALGLDGGKKPMRYYKNAGLSMAVSDTQLRTMMRNVTTLHEIMNTPEFKRYSTYDQKKAKEKGWVETKLPNVPSDLKMDSRLAAVFDDIAGNPQNWYQRLNSGITKLLFWMPVAHINNVGTHWFVGRGWDWMTPAGYKSLAKDGYEAMKSVVNQDTFQHQLRNNGVGTIYGSVLSRDPIKQFAKVMKVDMVARPSDWGPVADKLGVPLKALSDKIYDTSSKVMWSANDVFLTQRVMELMRKEGYTDFSGKVDTPEYNEAMRKAIIDAERDIPNYRVPHVIGVNSEKGRLFSKFLQNPALTAFGRYHYGMYNSYANIIRDAIGKEATAGDRLEAAGKLMAMAALTYAVYPIYDQFAKWITGNEHAKAARRGPTTIPTHIAEAAEGKQDIASFIRGSLTVPPLISAALGLYYNKDFRDKPIVDRHAVKEAAHGNLREGGKALVQAGEYVARNAISPLNTFASGIKKEDKDTSTLSAMGQVLRDQALDIKDPSKKAVKFERMQKIYNLRDSRSREKQGGSGPIEGLYNRATK